MEPSEIEGSTMSRFFLVIVAVVLGAALAFISIETLGIGILLVLPFVAFMRLRPPADRAASLIAFATGFLGAVAYLAGKSGVFTGRADMNTAMVYYGHAGLGVLGLAAGVSLRQGIAGALLCRRRKVTREF